MNGQALAALGLALVSPLAVTAAHEYEQARIRFGDEACQRLLRESAATGRSFQELAEFYYLAETYGLELERAGT